MVTSTLWADAAVHVFAIFLSRVDFELGQSNKELLILRRAQLKVLFQQEKEQ
jgi:hypothetical protein